MSVPPQKAVAPLASAAATPIEEMRRMLVHLADRVVLLDRPDQRRTQLVIIAGALIQAFDDRRNVRDAVLEQLLVPAVDADEVRQLIEPLLATFITADQRAFEEFVDLLVTVLMLEQSSLGADAAGHIRSNTEHSDISAVAQLGAMLEQADRIGQSYGLPDRTLELDRQQIPGGNLPPSLRPGSDPSAERWRERPQLRGENCTVFFTDVVGFGARTRNDEDRLIIRRAIFGMTQKVLDSLWHECYAEDRGDGLLIVAPPSIPTVKVMEHLLGRLPLELKRHNRIYGPSVQIQLRVAVNVGPVSSDGLDVSGKGIIPTARLLEAPILKAAVAESRASLGVIVSDFVYETAIRHGEWVSDPGAYKRVEVSVKESKFDAWMQLIDPAPGDGFWGALRPAEQRAFVSAARERTFAGGATLMREGETADHVIVILDGRTKICVDENGTERIIAERGPGQLVGERAALQVGVRSAAVVTLETVRALVMKTKDFAAFIGAHPSVLDIMERQIYDQLTTSRNAHLGDRGHLPRAGGPPEKYSFRELSKGPHGEPLCG